MQRLFATIALAFLQVGILTTTASADKVDISTVSCGQLIESIKSGSENDKTGMGGILYWIAGYTVTEEQGTVVDFGALGKDFEKIMTKCEAQPKLSLLNVSKQNLGENGTEQGSDAIDLATMTCEAAVKSSPQDSEGLGFILMWIAGYQASDAEDTIFDTESYVSSMKEIGEYCGNNPSIGLLTASDEVMGEDDSE
jgi:acid stress chaperone HdeB